MNNYRPVLLLPVFGKIFEKLISNEIYSVLDREKLLNTNQSGFRSFDSCANQLLTITHKIFSSFDCNPSLEVCSIFLGISKAFDKVWHEGLLYKPKSFGISGDLLNLIMHYLTDRSQRVLLNGQCSNWQTILAGVPQGSILGPLVFLIYINDLPDRLKSKIKLFADDTSLFSVVKNKEESASDLTNDLDMISKWAYNWKISFNPDPNKPAHEVLFSRKISNTTHSITNFDNVQVQRANHQRHLSITLDEKLNFKSDIDKILTKASKGSTAIKRLRNSLPHKSLITIYKAIIRSHLDYEDILYDQRNNATFRQKIDSFQYKAALAITGAIQGTSQETFLEELGLETLKSSR